MVIDVYHDNALAKMLHDVDVEFRDIPEIDAKFSCECFAGPNAPGEWLRGQRYGEDNAAQNAGCRVIRGRLHPG